MENIDKLNSESMAVYLMLLQILDEEDDENEIRKAFRNYIINRIKNGRNIR